MWQPVSGLVGISSKVGQHTQTIDNSTLDPIVLSTAPSICRNIPVAAIPKAVKPTSQVLTKIATAVPKVVAPMVMIVDVAAG